MTKDQYLKDLESYLSNLPEQERKDTLAHFREYFDESNHDIENIVAELGTPESLAKDILESLYPGVDISVNQPISIKPSEKMTIESNIQKVSITLEHLNIKILPSETDDFSIDYDHQYNPYFPSLDYHIQDGHLTITEQPAEARQETRESKGFLKQFFKVINQHNETFHLYLPENLTNIDITSHMGDIDISDISCQTLALKNIMSDITITDVDSNEADIFSTNGDVDIDNCQVLSGHIKTQNGDLNCTETTLHQLTLSCSNGDIEINQCQLVDNVIQMDNGDIDIDYSLLHRTKLDMKNGDIEITDTTLEENIHISNANGDTEISLDQELEDIALHLSNTMGDIDVDNSFGYVKKSLLKKTLDTNSLNPKAILTINSQNGDIEIF